MARYSSKRNFFLPVLLLSLVVVFSPLQGHSDTVVSPKIPFVETVVAAGDNAMDMANKNLVLGLAVVDGSKTKGYKNFADLYGLGTYYTLNASFVSILILRNYFSTDVMIKVMNSVDRIHFRMAGIKDQTVSGLGPITGSDDTDTVRKKVLYMLRRYYDNMVHFDQKIMIKSDKIFFPGFATNLEIFLVFSHSAFLQKAIFYEGVSAISGNNVLNQDITTLVGEIKKLRPAFQAYN